MAHHVDHLDRVADMFAEDRQCGELLIGEIRGDLQTNEATEERGGGR
jgi:hypothetical protein